MGKDVKSYGAILHALHGLTKYERMQSGSQRRRTVTLGLNIAALVQTAAQMHRRISFNHLPLLYICFKIVNVAS